MNKIFAVQSKRKKGIDGKNNSSKRSKEKIWNDLKILFI